MAENKTNAIFVEFGALADPIREQLAGLSCKSSNLSLWQKLADALTILAIHQVLPESQVQKARQKLTNRIGRSYTVSSEKSDS